MECSSPGSSVHGISQERILEWVAISFARGSSQSRDRTLVSCIGRWILYHWATREPQFVILCYTERTHLLDKPYVWFKYMLLNMTFFFIKCERREKNILVHLEREKQIPYINEYIWNLGKGDRWTYLQGWNRDTEAENRLVNTAGKGEGGTSWESSTHIYIYTAMRNTDSQREVPYSTGSSAQCPVTT